MREHVADAVILWQIRTTIAEKCNVRRSIPSHCHCLSGWSRCRLLGRECYLRVLCFERYVVPQEWVCRRCRSLANSDAIHVAAAIHLTRNLAVELGPRHILCNSISPGFFPSKMASGLMDIHGGVDAIAKQNPNGRLGRPEDIAGAVVYLSSRASTHINGHNIVLDGGGLWSKGRL